MTDFNWLNPDYRPVYAQRVAMLQHLREHPETVPAFRLVYRENPARFISDFGVTYDPRHAHERAASTPFVLFPAQEALINFIMARWKNREPGIIEKSRDVGASWLVMCVAVTLCTFYRGVTIGIGSRKEQLLDNGPDPSSLFYKARYFHDHLPAEFKQPMESAHMRLTFPGTESSIIGESGFQIGRGARSSLYFVDECAFVERDEQIDGALAATTDCRLDVSSANGTSNSFYRRRMSGKIPVHTLHWRSDPRKSQAWYEKKCRELPPHVVAGEIDISYEGSVENQLILPRWVQASIGAAQKLGIAVTGRTFASLDIADQGADDCAAAFRTGIELQHLHAWSGRHSDTYKSVVKMFGLCEQHGHESFYFDSDGLGSAVRGDAEQINRERQAAGKEPLIAMPFRGSASVSDPNGCLVPGRKNADFFLNAKAQNWWALRLRFQRTYEAVVDGRQHDPDNLISISPDLEDLAKLTVELSRPTFGVNAAGKVTIDKAPNSALSPNAADAAMIAYNVSGSGLATWVLLGKLA